MGSPAVTILVETSNARVRLEDLHDALLQLPEAECCLGLDLHEKTHEDLVVHLYCKYMNK